MSTPISKVIDVFHSKFQSKIELLPGLEMQFLINAMSEFSMELFPVSLNEVEGNINENLSSPEIYLLGVLMYKEYFHRERDKTLKLNNIVGRDIKLTAMGNSKYAMNTTYKALLDEIAVKVSKLQQLDFESQE